MLHSGDAVRYSPVCRYPDTTTTFSVVQGETVNITCDVEAEPRPNAFQWTLNNTIRGTVDLKRRHPRTFHILHYVPRYLGDYGTIMCWGKNSAGVQRVPCISHIVPEAAARGEEIAEAVSEPVGTVLCAKLPLDVYPRTLDEVTVFATRLEVLSLLIETAFSLPFANKII
ncbi:hypothetical protein AVEN_90021-1 [Araneus ventricosus]|uniref:Ig-like domain-containing protein n=1 Tax=Araneus ventricosus TaxID=182803 RepID=A0A4Y2DBY1_ARAVE|nr:hypothetical protein AVEN_90021-1 [Araneus ventricosus]